MTTTPTAQDGGPDTRAGELIDQITDTVRAKLPPEQAIEAAEFADQYYAQVAPEDLAERSLPDLYGAAMSHWHFARTFVGGFRLVVRKIISCKRVRGRAAQRSAV